MSPGRARMSVQMTRWFWLVLVVAGCATTPFRQVTIAGCPECFDACFQVARGQGADYLMAREYCQPHRLTVKEFSKRYDQMEAPACCHTAPWGQPCVLCR